MALGLCMKEEEKQGKRFLDYIFLMLFFDLEICLGTLISKKTIYILDFSEGNFWI